MQFIVFSYENSITRGGTCLSLGSLQLKLQINSEVAQILVKVHINFLQEFGIEGNTPWLSCIGTSCCSHWFPALLSISRTAATARGNCNSSRDTFLTFFSVRLSLHFLSLSLYLSFAFEVLCRVFLSLLFRWFMKLFLLFHIVRSSGRSKRS